MEWIIEHWKDILAIIGAAVSLATLIVAITPTQKDDALLAKIIKILAAIGLLNPDKSFIGTKKEEGK
jgi:Na+-transporting NADH:ubiquinone oxidoreductase subunit NqrC